MKKLLHERLRAIEDDNEVLVCDDGFNARISRKAGEHLADEIQRYYIPRPRFEDGEPVQWHSNDVAWDASHNSFMFNGISEAGVPLAFGSEYYRKAKMTNGFVVRKQPKVLDADGVPIKVGDTVYDLTGLYHTPLKVLEIRENDIKVSIPDGKGFTSFTPDNLTHKEPDSLIKLRDDIIDYGKEVHIDQIWDEKTDEWADRLSALIERGA